MAQYDKIAYKYLKERKNKKVFNYNNLIEIPNMVKFIGNIKDKKILDLGCGFGDHAFLYIKNGAKEVVGLDISRKLINMAKERNIKGASFIVYDLNKRLPFQNNSFDLVISSLTINYIKNFDQLFKEINRILKKDSWFIFSIENPVIFAAIKRKVNNMQEHVIGVKKINESKREVYGDYFNESLKKIDLGKGKIVKKYHRTYQTIIRTFLKNNFELIDYIDAEPILPSRKIDPSKYELTSKIPTFCFFKLKKK